MGDLGELILLLFLMVTGYSATRDRHAIQREALTGFAGWAVMFAVLIALVVVRPLMVAAIWLGMTVGVVYFLWWVATWLAYEFSGIPEISGVSRRQVLGVCRYLAPDRAKTLREAARRALKDHDKCTVLSALMTLRDSDATGERLCDALREECDRVAEQHNDLVEHLRDLCGGARRLDYAFISRLAARYGEDAVRRGLQKMGNADRPARMRLPGHVHDAFRDRARARLLNQVHIEVHAPQDDEPLPHVVPGGRTVTSTVNIVVALVVGAVIYQVRRQVAGDALELGLAAYFFIGIFTPLYVYLAIGALRRAALFGGPYLILLVYCVLLFHRGNEAAWVFLAVVALLHVSALLNLDAVCRMQVRHEGRT